MTLLLASTSIVYGAQARARGRALQIVAVSLVVVDALFVAIVWYVAGDLADPSTWRGGALTNGTGYERYPCAHGTD